jgi:hypothetical protein
MASKGEPWLFIDRVSDSPALATAFTHMVHCLFPNFNASQILNCSASKMGGLGQLQFG